MFLYDEDNRLQEVRFVDFQISYFGSIAQDLYHFMVTSWETDSKVSRFDNLMLFYSGRFQENLKLLQYQGHIPTHEELMAELERRKIFRKYDRWTNELDFLFTHFVSTAALLSIEFLPFPLADEKMEIDEDSLAMLYANERVRKAYSVLIPWLDERNALVPPS